MISRHQVETALGNIRVLGPDIEVFRRDVKIVSDYVDQVTRHDEAATQDAEFFRKRMVDLRQQITAALAQESID